MTHEEFTNSIEKRIALLAIALRAADLDIAGRIASGRSTLETEVHREGIVEEIEIEADKWLEFNRATTREFFP